MNNPSAIIKEIEKILDSAFFCPLTVSFSERVKDAEEISIDFHLDRDLMKEYTKTARKLLDERKEDKNEKTIKKLKNNMQFLHLIIFKKFKKDHPDEVNDYKRYEKYLYKELSHFDDFVFEPEWVEAVNESFGMKNVIEELERVVAESEKKLPLLSNREYDEVEKRSEDITSRVDADIFRKNELSFRKYLIEEILPKEAEKYRPFLYINLYKQFCFITLQSWLVTGD